MVSKAVILARGLGTRMRAPEGADDWSIDGTQLAPEVQAVANQGIKAMVPVHGRPFLDYCVQSLVRAGFRDICMVIGPHREHEVIREYCERDLGPRLPAGARFLFAYQEEPLGTAHAVLAAREVVGEDGFAVVNGDNLYPERSLRLLREASGADGYTVAYHREHLVARSNFKPERVAHFAVVDIDPETGALRRIVEKPAQPELYAFEGVVWVSMNSLRLPASAIEACAAIEASPRGEYELPDVVQYLIDRGARFQVVFSREGVLDLTRRHDILLVEQRLRDWTWTL